jgi:hypothetical protein
VTSHGAVPAQRVLLTLIAACTLSRAPVAAGAPADASPSANALQACASVTDGAARLACYDRLAGQAAAPPKTAVSAPPSTSAVSPTRVDTPARPPDAAAPPPPAPAAAPPAADTRAAAPPASGSFGLYSAEHPKSPPAAPALQGAVTSIGRSPSGRMMVSLDGGALWELEDTDPLLAVGDAITITRATFGSYLMHTPTRRIHRVRRLR